METLSDRCNVTLLGTAWARALLLWPFAWLTVASNGLTITVKPRALEVLFFITGFARPPRRGSPAYHVDWADIDYMELSTRSWLIRATSGGGLACAGLRDEVTPTPARAAQRHGVEVRASKKIIRWPWQMSQ